MCSGQKVSFSMAGMFRSKKVEIKHVCNVLWPKSPFQQGGAEMYSCQKASFCMAGMCNSQKVSLCIAGMCGGQKVSVCIA
jgi:hypothetical protein